jgi:hypothetical protein
VNARRRGSAAFACAPGASGVRLCGVRHDPGAKGLSSSTTQCHSPSEAVRRCR